MTAYTVVNFGEQLLKIPGDLSRSRDTVAHRGKGLTGTIQMRKI